MESNFEEKQPFSKRNIFTVQDGYFDVLESKIHQRTRKNESYSWYLLKSNSFKVALAVATIVLAFFLWPSTDTTSPEQLLTDVSEEELIRYLEENTLPEQDDILSYINYDEEGLSTLDINALNDSIL